MPGGFAHVTAAATALGRLSEVRGLSGNDKRALTQFMPFVEVGSVGPDYPYLGGQSGWADRMHYRATGEVIRNGVRLLRDYEHGPRRNRCLAWLLGYAAHVATDLTIHPIVEARVGPYDDNKTGHRVCEMHQDAFIWPQRNLGEIGIADHFRVCISQCSNEDGALHPDLTAYWEQILETTYPEDVTVDPPQPDEWNKGFRRIVDAVDDVGSFFSFTRHLLEGLGAAYPRPNEIDRSFIMDLETPEGPMHYNDIFGRAVSSVVSVWSTIGEAVHAANSDVAEEHLRPIPDGNLDKGCELADSSMMIYWRPA